MLFRSTMFRETYWDRPICQHGRTKLRAVPDSPIHSTSPLRGCGNDRTNLRIDGRSFVDRPSFPSRYRAYSRVRTCESAATHRARFAVRETACSSKSVSDRHQLGKRTSRGGVSRPPKARWRCQSRENAIHPIRISL